WSWCRQRDQLVRINRQIVLSQGPIVLQEIPCHPVILAGTGNIPNLLAEVAPVQLRTALARRTDVPDRESRIVSHRDQRSLPVTRVSFDAHAFRINGFVALEVIERPARTPCPRAQRAPVVQLSR